MTDLGMLFLPFWLLSIIIVHGIKDIKSRCVFGTFIETKKESSLSILLAIIMMCCFYLYNKPEYRVKRAYQCLYDYSETYRTIYHEGIDSYLKRFKPSIDEL